MPPSRFHAPGEREAPALPGVGEQLWLLGAALAASLAAIFWSARHHVFLLYGDAEAHLHIARRLFDSHRVGPGQLGSVWLPLPHLILAPFAAVDGWWRDGFAPVVPAALCYLVAVPGLYRLLRKWLEPLPSALSAALFAANPNLLYLQTTAMTEPLFLAELIWSVLLLVEWRGALDASAAKINSSLGARHLWPLTGVLVCAVATRYDGWILAFVAWLMMAITLLRRGGLFQRRFIAASFALLAAPVLWMVYNSVYFGDWLDFLRGPYSAKAIEMRTSSGVFPPHPGWHDPWVSTLFFWKASELDAFARGWGWVLLMFSVAGLLLLFARGRFDADHGNGGGRCVVPGLRWTLLLWFPLPFYAYSVSYGSVPIFLPVWWPHSWYNTRYGMEMLPGFAFAFGFAAERLLNATRQRTVVAVALGFMLVANLGEMLEQGPLVFVEGRRNYEARGYYNTAIGGVIARLHELDPRGLLLLDTSSFPTIIPRAGMTYRETLNESDKEFFRAALAAPAAHADMVLAFAGDEVAAAVRAHPDDLRLAQCFHSSGQADACLYISELSPLARGNAGGP